MNAKKIIIIVIIIILIVIIGISIILKNLEKKEVQIDEETGDPGEVIDYSQENTKKVTDNVDFYTVQDCINSYLDTININNTMYYGTDDNDNYAKIITDEEINEYIYALLSKEYIEKNQITIENLGEHIQYLEQDVIFTPLKMNVLMRDTTDKYVVYGILTDAEYNMINEIYIFVNLDLTNNTFSIEPIYEKYEDISEIEIENSNNAIESNDFNKITQARVNYEYLCREHLNTYKKLILSAPELAYEYLDEEYKQERFENYENFRQYITDNYNNLFTLNLAEYQVNTYDDYSEYVCVDDRGNYYLFTENDEVMNFQAQLDTYTIKSETFVENYNKLKDSEKTSANVSIFIQMLNNKDYKHAYEVLSQGFRNNYFPTEEEFKNYVQQNFYDYNTIELQTTNNEGEIYIYNSVITNGNNSEETKSKIFNVLLGEGTDFTISFNVE